MKEFFVLEGLDATGKSTIVNALSEIMPVYKTPPKEMEKYRKYFNDNLEERLIYYLSGVMCVGKEINQTGGITDRYLLSTLAAHEAMGVPAEFFEALMPVILSIPKPEKTIILTASEEVRMNRLKSRGANQVDLDNCKINSQILEGFRKWSEKLNMNIVEVDTSDLTIIEVLNEVQKQLRG